MAYFVVECRDSDGNDCTVYDFIVQASDKEAALGKVMDECMSRVPDAEEDGGFGAYYSCECGEDSDCEGHGGFSLDECNVPAFETLDEARDASSVYHSTEELD